MNKRISLSSGAGEMLWAPCEQELQPLEDHGHRAVPWGSCWLLQLHRLLRCFQPRQPSLRGRFQSPNVPLQEPEEK